jgi:hypothetical protein
MTLKVETTVDAAVQRKCYRQVVDRMIELDMWDIGVWVRCYIELSGFLPTENTFTHFENIIKSLTIYLPPAPKAELWTIWANTRVLHQGLTSVANYKLGLDKRMSSEYKNLLGVQMQTFLGSGFWKIFKDWLVQYFMPNWKSNEQIAFEQRALLFTAPPNAGKSKFIDWFMAPYTHVRLDFSKYKRFQSTETYARATVWWFVNDLNNVSEEKLVEMQNVISGSGVLEAKYKPSKADHITKPMIVCQHLLLVSFSLGRSLHLL